MGGVISGSILRHLSQFFKRTIFQPWREGFSFSLKGNKSSQEWDMRKVFRDTLVHIVHRKRDVCKGGCRQKLSYFLTNIFIFCRFPLISVRLSGIRCFLLLLTFLPPSPSKNRSMHPSFLSISIPTYVGIKDCPFHLNDIQQKTDDLLGGGHFLCWNKSQIDLLSGAYRQIPAAPVVALHTYYNWYRLPSDACTIVIACRLGPELRRRQNNEAP